MEFLVIFSVVLVLFAGCIVLCFGDPDSDDFLGRSSSYLTVKLPALFIFIAKKLRVWWIFRGIGIAVNFFINERHPIIQILYIMLVFGGYGVFLFKGYPLLPNPYFEAYHKINGAILFILCVVTFLMTSFSDPGIITKENVAGYKLIFPYDNFMYQEKICTGCVGIDKVARSKHCRYLKACVASYGGDRQPL
jgi:hypothetical protein